MWERLPIKHKNEYKKMILTFASLTELFAQKVTDGDEEITLTPIINSKYQETVFQRVFNASAEDIGNTSYDATIAHKNSDGTETKYLIGIKTFGFGSGAQKVAQFKANIQDWADIINKIRKNADEVKNLGLSNDITKEKIDTANHDMYLQLATHIAELRNLRIASSEANLQGFSITPEKDDVQAVYHVLMPAKEDNTPVIFVGETPYDRICVENIKILGSTGLRTPTNFDFTDGNHKYRFTSADSQLLMDFNNRSIVQEKWDVIYADDAYQLFSKLGEHIYESPTEVITESYSWKLTNKRGEMELFSGFNSFYGVGSKLTSASRQKQIDKVSTTFKDSVDASVCETVTGLLSEYLLTKASNADDKKEKILLRDKIAEYTYQTGNSDFIEVINKMIYRPTNEMYIPIPNSKKFHEEHPNFFAPNAGSLKDNSASLALPAAEREFNLTFEPSGKSIRSYITQDNGKAIESTERQTYLGEWLLRGVFQLNDHEPLTADKLKDLGINALRLYKTNQSNDIHLKFIWIDDDDLPNDYWS